MRMDPTLTLGAELAFLRTSLLIWRRSSARDTDEFTQSAAFSYADLIFAPTDGQPVKDKNGDYHFSTLPTVHDIRGFLGCKYTYGILDTELRAKVANIIRETASDEEWHTTLLRLGFQQESKYYVRASFGNV